jgi:6-pyruvoyltetrahydropterin/6-carboxytetrahydropterin synthase
MFKLRKKFTFEASHRLPQHDGKCQRLHGHSWVGELLCEDTELVTTGPKAGMLVDFGDLSAAVKPLVEKYLDHWHLNDTTGLDNPTSEELARWIYNKLKPDLPWLVAVTIQETCTSSCEYRP